jgi:hypothetical protein
MKKITALFLVLVSLHAVCRADERGEREEAQLQKEKALATALQNLVTCKMTVGVLYCSLSFRGLQLEFAGPNDKSGSAIYVYSLGKHQMLSPIGSKCIRIAFDDEDLRGKHIAAHILFREDAVITHNYLNTKARAECS